jgi:23S rRNA pseudouridine1911/1915/1917 synthase
MTKAGDDPRPDSERRVARAPTIVVVGPDERGRPVEKVLARRLSASWAHVNKLLRQGRVQTDERALAHGESVVVGQKLTILPAAASAPRPPAPNRRLPLRVVHEDADLLVVAKAAGVTVHPGPGHGTDTLLNALVARYPDLVALGPEREWGLVHRLDRETSGLLLVARSARAYEALVAAFSERRVKKEYLALVAGRPSVSPGEVTTPVEGKEARTRYEVVESASGASLVRAWPETGRMHQVRLHLTEVGCPVLGDAQHGSKQGSVATPSVRVPRLALHAHRLELAHPVSGAPLVFEELLPRDLRRVWRWALSREGRAGAPGDPSVDDVAAPDGAEGAAPGSDDPG